MRLLFLTSCLILLAALVIGCSRPGEAPDAPPPPHHYSLPADLLEKRAVYRELAPSRQNANGFIETDHCDSLLLTSLLGVGGVPITNIHAAEEPGVPGKWLRRDLDSGRCYPNGGSKSSISRDMLLGLMWYAWHQRSLSILEQLYEYGSNNDWVMGEGDVARTGMRTLRGTLAAAIHALGGSRRIGEELLTDPQLIVKEGYEAHLQVLIILLRGEIYGELSTYSLHVIRGLADENPDSPIMQAAAARWVHSDYAARFLAAARNTQYFPAYRLPTSADRCIDWATQQNSPADWIPCPERGKIHSGGDLLFAMYVIQEDK